MKKLTIVEKLVCLSLIFLIGLPFANALEFQADKNVAFTFQAPLIAANNTSIFSPNANNTAFYIGSNDNTTWAAAASNITDIGGGWYNFSLNQSEMNHNRIQAMYNQSGYVHVGYIINTLPKTNITADIAAVKSDTAAVLTDTAAVDTTSEMRTFLTGGDTAVSTLTTANLGGLTNVTLAATQTGVTIPTVTTLTGHTAQTGDAYAIVNHASYGNSALKTSLGNGSVISASVTGNVGGNVTGSVGSLSATAIQSIWDALTSALTTAGSIGKLIVDNLNAAITSRMATFTLPGNFSALEITSDGNVTTSAGDPWSTDVSTGYAGQAGEMLRKIDKNTKAGR